MAPKEGIAPGGSILNQEAPATSHIAPRLTKMCHEPSERPGGGEVTKTIANLMHPASGIDYRYRSFYPFS